MKKPCWICDQVGGKHKDTCPELAWPTYSFYSTESDVESLHCDNAEEAIVEFLQDTFHPSEDITEDAIREDIGEITVYGWRRLLIPDNVLELEAQRATENINESLWDDYGDMDGDHPPLDDKNQKLLTEVIANTLKGLTSNVWRCEQVAQRRYNVEEIIEIAHDWSLFELAPGDWTPDEVTDLLEKLDVRPMGISRGRLARFLTRLGVEKGKL